VPGAKVSYQSVYLDDDDGVDEGGVLQSKGLQRSTGNKRKLNEEKKPAGSRPLVTTKSEAAAAAPKRGRSSTDGTLTNQSSSLAIGPFSVANWFQSPSQAMAEFCVAQSATMNDSTARFLRVTVKPISHLDAAGWS
jgi:hypothetical protein